ncbi:MAG: hypothetical protein LBU03_02410 [Tannerellaceae bacterium]|jgi:uncharacterized membrane protein|nr:hypothetical protein [Tannerellaceae bacterium]
MIEDKLVRSYLQKLFLELSKISFALWSIAGLGMMFTEPQVTTHLIIMTVSGFFFTIVFAVLGCFFSKTLKK